MHIFNYSTTYIVQKNQISSTRQFLLATTAYESWLDVRKDPCLNSAGGSCLHSAHCIAQQYNHTRLPCSVFAMLAERTHAPFIGCMRARLHLHTDVNSGCTHSLCYRSNRSLCRYQALWRLAVRISALIFACLHVPFHAHTGVISVSLQACIVPFLLCVAPLRLSASETVLAEGDACVQRESLRRCAVH